MSKTQGLWSKDINVEKDDKWMPYGFLYRQGKYLTNQTKQKIKVRLECKVRTREEGHACGTPLARVITFKIGESQIAADFIPLIEVQYPIARDIYPMHIELIHAPLRCSCKEEGEAKDYLQFIIEHEYTTDLINQMISDSNLSNIPVK